MVNTKTPTFNYYNNSTNVFFILQILDNLAFRAYDSSRERFSVGLDYEANRRPLFSKFMALLTTNAGLPIKNYYQLEYAEELNFNNMVKKLADMFGVIINNHFIIVFMQNYSYFIHQ